jgi:FHA domain
MVTLTWERDGEVQHIDVVAGEAVIGRSDEADAVLADPTISRRHAVLRSTDHGFELEHLSRTNPTLLNGRPLEKPTPLRDGDRLEFGTLPVRFQDLGHVPVEGRIGCPSCHRVNEANRADCWYCGENMANATMSGLATTTASCGLVGLGGERVTLVPGERHCFPAPAGIGRECDATIESDEDGPVVIPAASNVVAVNSHPIGAKMVLAHGDRVTIGGTAYLVLRP